MARTNKLVQHGNRILVRFDGQTVGLLQSLRASDDYGHEPASEIGDIHVQEWVPSMARHTINVSHMVLKTATLLSKDIAQENGDEVLRGLTFDIEVYDKDTGRLVRKFVDCAYVSGDIEVSKHAIVITNAVFNALDARGTMIS